MNFIHPNQVQAFILDNHFPQGGAIGVIANRVWDATYRFKQSNPVKFYDYPLYGVYEQRWKAFYDMSLKDNIKFLQDWLAKQ